MTCEIPRKKPLFIVSLDTEIAWGWLSFEHQRKYYYPLFKETKSVIFDLLDLMDQYNVPATWAIVGRLLEHPNIDNERVDSAPLPIFRPGIKESDVYSDPEIHPDIENSLVAFPDLVDIIKNRKTTHEIATHTYNHAYYNDISDLPPDVLITDLQSAIRICKEKGAGNVSTIVFPKNQVWSSDLLKRCNISVARAPNTAKYRYFTKSLSRTFNKLDACLPTTGMPVTPYKDKNNVIFIPGSQIFRVSHLGTRRHIPISFVTKKCLLGINKAIEQQSVYHIWFHPFNFAHKRNEHMRALETVFQYLKDREKEISTVTMSECASMWKQDLGE